MTENPIRRLREHLRWNQADLGRAVGRSWQSVQNYEAGKRVPQEVIEKLKAIAAQHGLGDIAMELSSEEWQVRRVFHPGEAIISQAPRAGATAASTRGRAASPDREACHQIVDEIFDSGDVEAISAVSQNLRVMARCARRGPASARLRKK